MNYFSTFFDKNYLARGLTLIESIKKNADDFEIYVLCLDDVVYDFFETNKEQYYFVTTVLLSEIEKDDAELFQCKNNRTPIEYYFTLSPCLPLYILKKFNLPHICSLDADIKFYSSPEKIFEYLDEYSIIITPHKFAEENIRCIKYGVFNVSFQIFKNDVTGLSCLNLWRKQCIEWCKDELEIENSRYADQLYLNNWPLLYQNKIKILDDNVSGIAVWNLSNFNITVKDNLFKSNNEPLIFYHFHYFKIYRNIVARNGFDICSVKNTKPITALYQDYWTDLKKFTSKNSPIVNNSFRNVNNDDFLSILKQEKTFFIWFRMNKIYFVNFKQILKIGIKIKSPYTKFKSIQSNYK